MEKENNLIKSLGTQKNTQYENPHMKRMFYYFHFPREKEKHLKIHTEIHIQFIERLNCYVRWSFISAWQVAHLGIS